MSLLLALQNVVITSASIATIDGADIQVLSIIATTGSSLATIDGSDIQVITGANWTTGQIATIDGSNLTDIYVTSERINRGGGWERFESIPKRKISAKIKEIVKELIVEKQDSICDLQIECSVNEIVYYPEYGEYLITELKKAIQKAKDDEDESISILLLM